MRCSYTFNTRSTLPSYPNLLRASAEKESLYTVLNFCLSNLLCRVYCLSQRYARLFCEELLYRLLSSFSFFSFLHDGLDPPVAVDNHRGTHLDTWIPGYLDTWITGCLDAWTSYFKPSRCTGRYCIPQSLTINFPVPLLYTTPNLLLRYHQASHLLES
jgi:hypothetical protein